MKLFLKGSRCDSPKCADRARDHPPPGMHGTAAASRANTASVCARSRSSNASTACSSASSAATSSWPRARRRTPARVLLTIMERRLDNVVHRLGFAPIRGSRPPAGDARPCSGQRQGMQHPQPAAQGRRHRDGQELGQRSLTTGQAASCRTIQPPVARFPGDDRRRAARRPRLIRLPTRGDVDPRIQDIREQLIIEFCSALEVSDQSTSRGRVECSQKSENAVRTCFALCSLTSDF